MQYIPSFDPSVKQRDSFTASLANGGWLLIINESPVGVTLVFGNGQQHLVPPNFYRCMRVDTRITTVDWSQTYTLPQSQAPISQIFGEAYNQNEWTLGEIMGPLPRQINLGNPASVGGVAKTLLDDSDPAGTQFIEATPTGQGFSSWNRNVDASGFEQVLSANTAKKIINVTRGDFGATKAIIVFGDSGDTGITTFYGTIGAGSVVPAATLTNLFPKHITLNGTQADETFAGAGDLFVPQGLHVAGNYLGTGGFCVFGDKLKADGATITTDGAGKLTIAQLSSDATKITTDGAGNLTIASGGALNAPRVNLQGTLSASNKTMDLQQGYQFFSDNTDAFGTTRLWFDGPDRGSFQIGPRSGLNYFDWVRIRATRVTLDLGKNTSPNTILFDVQGGATHLDTGTITTDGSGFLTVVKLQSPIVQASGGIVAVGGTGATRSVDVDGFTANQVSISTSDDGGGHASGLALIFNVTTTANAAQEALKLNANGVAAIGTDDAGTKRRIQEFEGTTDPAGRTGITTNEGDLWFNG